MTISDLQEMATEITTYEKKFRESEARRVMLECEVAARGYEIEAMYNSLLEQEKIHIEEINLLQQIVDHIPMPIFWKDMSGKCLGCNKACEDALGLTKSNIIGKTVFDLFDIGCADIYNNADMETIKYGKYTYTTVFKSVDGSLETAVFYMTIFYNCDGDKAGIIVFAHTRCDGNLCP